MSDIFHVIRSDIKGERREHIGYRPRSQLMLVSEKRGGYFSICLVNKDPRELRVIVRVISSTAEKLRNTEIKVI